MTVRLTSGPIPLNAPPDKIMHANAAIIGVGQSAYTRQPQPGQSTHTFIRDAVVAALADAEIDPGEVDGMAVASFSLAPDAAIDLAWKLGLSLRWLVQDTNGGSSAMNMLGHALRAVETGAASVILVAGGDATGLGGYAKVAANFNVVTQLHLAPLGHGGPNGVYALVTSRQMKTYGLQKSDYGHLAIAQRAWAAHNPYAVYRAPMTMEDYLAAPLVADPLSRYDCVPVVAGAQAIVVANPDRCPRGRAGVRVRAHRASFNYDNQEGDGLQTGITTFAGELWRAAGVDPGDIDVASIYDDYPTMVLAAQRSRHDPGQRSRALRAPRHRRATVSPQHLGWDALRRPAWRTRGRTKRNLGSGAAIAASRRRAASRGRKARGDDRIWHDAISLWGHRRGRRVGAGGMNRGVAIWRCVKCRTGFFPQRLLCARCHGATFEEDRVYEAVVEEISTIRHMLGQTDWQPRRIASVRTSDGQRLTVGLTDESEPGTVIELFEESAAPFGAAKK